MPLRGSAGLLPQRPGRQGRHPHALQGQPRARSRTGLRRRQRPRPHARDGHARRIHLGRDDADGIGRHGAGPVQLIPADPAAALQVRFMDRFFDLHVMAPVQHAVNAALTGDPAKRVDGVAWAADKLEKAYAWLEGEWARRTWAAGDGFTMADCAAAPALFYADWTHPIAATSPLLRSYRARLLARPSFAQAVEGGRPYRHYFPLGAPDRD